MDKYIKYDDVLALAREHYSQGIKEEAVPVGAIKNIPTVKVVPVIRCEYCEYGKLVIENLYSCKDGMMYHHGSFYCAEGKRREDGRDVEERKVATERAIAVEKAMMKQNKYLDNLRYILVAETGG